MRITTNPGTDAAKRRNLRALAVLGAALSCCAVVVWIRFEAVARGSQAAPTGRAARAESVSELAPLEKTARVGVDGPRESAASDTIEVERGELCFLSAADRTPVAGEWFGRRLGVDGEQSTSFHSDEQGRARLPIGDWRLEARDAQVEIGDARIESKAHETAVVWVFHRGSLEFRLIDSMGRPIRDVHAEWYPFARAAAAAASDASSRESRLTQRADADGRVKFSDCAVDSGVAVFLHPEFARRVYWVSAPEPRTIELTLASSRAAPREVEFVHCGDGAPLGAIVVRSTLGTSLATDAGSPGSVALPAWIAEDEPLIVESPTTVRSAFQLSAIQKHVAVHRTAHLRVVLRSSESTDASLEFSARCPRNDSACATPMLGDVRRVRTNVEQLLECPADSIVALKAWGSDGTFDEREVAVGGADECVELQLCAAPNRWSARVVDESGVPVSDAWARSPRSSGGSATVRADPNGNLSLPLDSASSTFEIGAPNHVSVRIVRAIGKEPTSEQAEIVLHRARRFIVRTLGASDEPLAGLAIRVRPSFGAASAQSFASDVWSPGPRSSATRVSDAGGRAEFVGDFGDACRVEVGLPVVHRVDELGGTLPLATEEFVFDDQHRECVVRVAAPMHVALRVLEASSGLPVEGFRVRCTDRAFEVEVDGDVWSSWIPSNVATLRIEVPAVGRAEFDCSGVKDGELSTVRVVPAVLTDVVVNDANGRGIGGRVRLSVSRREPNGTFALGAVDLRLEAGRGQLCLPYSGELEVALASIAGNAIFDRSVPHSVPWESGGRVEFRLDERR